MTNPVAGSNPARPIEAMENKMTISIAVQNAMTTAKNADQLHPDDYEYDSVVNDVVVLAAAIEDKDKRIRELKLCLDKWSWARRLFKTRGKIGEYIQDISKEYVEGLEAVVEGLGSTASASLTTHCPVTGEHFHDVSKAHESLANSVMQRCEAAIAAKETNSGPLGPNLPVNPVTYGPVNAAKEQETTVEEAVNNTADIDIVFCDTCGAPHIVIEHDGMPSWCKNHGPEATKETTDDN